MLDLFLQRVPKAADWDDSVKRSKFFIYKRRDNSGCWIILFPDSDIPTTMRSWGGCIGFMNRWIKFYAAGTIQ